MRSRFLWSLLRSTNKSLNRKSHSLVRKPNQSVYQTNALNLDSFLYEYITYYYSYYNFWIIDHFLWLFDPLFFFPFPSLSSFFAFCFLSICNKMKGRDEVCMYVCMYYVCTDGEKRMRGTTTLEVNASARLLRVNFRFKMLHFSSWRKEAPEMQTSSSWFKVLSFVRYRQIPSTQQQWLPDSRHKSLLHDLLWSCYSSLTHVLCWWWFCWLIDGDGRTVSHAKKRKRLTDSSTAFLRPQPFKDASLWQECRQQLKDTAGQKKSTFWMSLNVMYVIHSFNTVQWDNYVAAITFMFSTQNQIFFSPGINSHTLEMCSWPLLPEGFIRKTATTTFFLVVHSVFIGREILQRKASLSRQASCSPARKKEMERKEINGCGFFNLTWVAPSRFKLR